MLSNFIYAKKRSLFEEKLNAGEILDEAIVFIEDTKEIWNHGTYFAHVPENISAFVNNADYQTKAQVDSAISSAISNVLNSSF